MGGLDGIGQIHPKEYAPAKLRTDNLCRRNGNGMHVLNARTRNVAPQKFFTAEQLEAIAKDFHHAGLEEKEVVMMEYAQKVVRDASSLRRATLINCERSAGLTKIY